MALVTNDATAVALPDDRTSSGVGLALAIASACCFGLSGTLASGLFATGWNAGAVVLMRLGIAAAVVLPLGIHALGGRWHLLRVNAGLITLYGVLAVATAQFCYFSALQHMAVAPALLIEYTAPVAVVAWMWLRRGQRPGVVTVAGAVIAGLGLTFVLDLFSDADISVAGVLWALGAMVGAAGYFIISGDGDNGLPPLTLAAGGLVVGGLTLGALSLVGALPLAGTTAQATYAGHVFPWWAPFIALGVVTAALAYAFGIAAARRLGSRLASFVALSEVLAAVIFAWFLLGQAPRGVQLLGGVLVMLGVVGVKLGERATIHAPAPEPGPERPPAG